MKLSFQNTLCASLALLFTGSFALAEGTHSAQYDSYLQWAKSTLYNDDSATKIADFLDSYPQLQMDLYSQRALEAVIQSRLSVAGNDQAQIEGTLAYIKKALPPETATLGNFQAEYQKASNYASAYTWARSTMMLPDARAKKLADLIQRYPMSFSNALERTIQVRASVDGVDQLDSITSRLAQSLPPEGSDPTAQIQEAFRKADNYKRTYDWSKQTLRLPDDLALEIAHTVDLKPAEEAPQIQNQIQALAQAGKGRAAIENALSDLSKYPVWEISADGKKVVGCSQKSLVDTKFKARIPFQNCFDAIHSRKYQWTDDAQTSCAIYTDSGAFIRATNSEDCSDPITRDMKPCLKTLDHDYRFYHYSNRGKIVNYKDTGISDDDAIKNHALLWSEHAYAQQGSGNAGLYTAIDPMDSRNYAGQGDDMFLYRVEIPKGTTYLPIVSRTSINASCPFSPESVKILKQAGCQTDLNHLVENENYTSSPSCYAMMKQTFKKLHLRGWSYNYGASRISGCENRTIEAFVWTNLEDLPSKDIQLFRGTPPAAGDPAHAEAVEIERLFNKEGHSSLWPSLSAEASADGGRSMDEIKSSLYGCENLIPKDPVADPAVSCDRQPASGLEATQSSMNNLKAVAGKSQ